MRPVRALIESLVERRLWPVALLLVVAIFAVPLTLGKSAPAETAADSVPASGSGAGGAGPSLPGSDSASASIIQNIGSGRGLRLLTREDPFAQHGIKAKSTTSAGSSATATGGASTTLGSGGTTTPSSTSTPISGTGSTTTVTPISPTPVAPTYLTVAAGMTFGRIGHLVRHRDLARLSALPSATHPIIIFLGIIKGSRTGVFLVPSDVHPSGEGSCHPSASNCQTVHLAVGQTEFFDAFDSAGASQQYELDFTRLAFRRTSSKAAAEHFLRRVSKPGQAVLKASGARLDVRYDAKIGRLVKAKAKPQQDVAASDSSSDVPAPMLTSPAPATTGGGDGTAPPSSLGSLLHHSGSGGSAP
jgi:hypothetical protein